jgi:hypothetical protein
MYRSRSTGAKAIARLLLLGAVIGTLACQDAPTTSPSPQLTPATVLTAPSAGLAGALPGLAADWPNPVRAGTGPAAPPVLPTADPLSMTTTGKARRKLHCVQTEPRTASAVIGPEGGTLRIGRHRLIVPAGALRERTLITGTVPGDSSATVLFEPSGLKFKAPAILVVSVSGCEAPPVDPSVIYIDDAGRPVEELPSVFDRTREEVTAPIHHFSGYQVWV